MTSTLIKKTILFCLKILINEIEIVVEDFIQLDLKELADLLSEDFELEFIPSAIPAEKSIAEEEIKKLKKTEERLITKFTCPKFHNKYLRESNIKKHEKKCYIGTSGVPKVGREGGRFTPCPVWE